MANEVVKDSELKVDVEEEKEEKNKDKSIEIKGIEKNEVKKFDNVRYNSCNHNFKEIPKCKHDIIKSELSTEEYNNALYSVDYSKFVKYIQEEYKEKCKNKKNDKNNKNNAENDEIFGINISNEEIEVLSHISSLCRDEFNNVSNFSIQILKILDDFDKIVYNLSKQINRNLLSNNKDKDYDLKYSYFIRLDECSPKDSMFGIGPFTNFYKILRSIICSNRCKRALTVRWKNKKNIMLWCVPWRSDINIKNEFRCFIRNKRLNAISQYACYDNFDWFDNEKKRNILKYEIYKPIENMICKICKNLNLNAFVMDIHLNNIITKKENFNIELIELNPFGALLQSGSCLFHWIHDFDQLYGINQYANKIEIRVVTQQQIKDDMKQEKEIKEEKEENEEKQEEEEYDNTILHNKDFNCKGQHDLKLFIVDINEHFQCNKCQDIVDIEVSMYGCHLCKYYICLPCTM